MAPSEIREFELTWRWRRSSLETPAGQTAPGDDQELKSGA
jgi:hypothetical protein